MSRGKHLPKFQVPVSVCLEPNDHGKITSGQISRSTILVNSPAAQPGQFNAGNASNANALIIRPPYDSQKG